MTDRRIKPKMTRYYELVPCKICRTPFYRHKWKGIRYVTCSDECSSANMKHVKHVYSHATETCETRPSYMMYYHRARAMARKLGYEP